MFKRKLREIRLHNFIIVCWYGYCRYGEVGCDPKKGGPPGGPRCWKSTSLGYKWPQKLIIICCYGYCGYSEADCDPKMGGPPGGPQSVKNAYFDYKLRQKLIIIFSYGSYGYSEVGDDHTKKGASICFKLLIAKV